MINKINKIDKRIVFAEKYITLNFNATVAYRETYGEHLNHNTAAVSASHLLRNPKIQEYLRDRLAVLELDSNYVLRKLKDLAENAKSDGTKLQAIMAIGKSLGMFSDNIIPNPEADMAARSASIAEYFKSVFANTATKRQKELDDANKAITNINYDIMSR